MNNNKLYRNHNGVHVVSTVALPAPYSVDEYQFETMVFACNENGSVIDFTDVDCMRYTTKGEALAGHVAMCKTWGVPYTALVP